MLMSVAVAALGATEEGWDLLFRSNTSEVDNVCFPTTAAPQFIHGMYLFASVGLLEMGGLRFQDVLDGFGKIHRFVITAESICFSAKMMDTGVQAAQMPQHPT